MFNELFSENIISISCGSNEILNDLIEISRPSEKDSSQYTTQKVTITKAMHDSVGDLFN